MKKDNPIFLFTALSLALLYCFALNYLQLKGALLAIAGVSLFVALFLTSRRSDIFLGLIIVLVALAPFFLSVRIIPGVPKLYIEDVIVLNYAGFMVISYGLFRTKRLHLGSGLFLAIFFLFFLCAATSFMTIPPAETAYRNFTETFILGLVCYFIFVNEINESNVSTLMNVLGTTSLILAVAVCFEGALQKNPIMEYAERFFSDFVYIDPETVRNLRAYYRPYGVYFQPSETGTFLVMGFPLVYHMVRNWQTPLKYLTLAVATAGIVVNYTRGAWIALAVTLVLCNFRRIRRFLPAMALAGALVLSFAYMTAGNSAFVQRFSDPSNLYTRAYYWQLGLNIFMEEFPFGIGHMNFENHYMDYVDTVPAPNGLNVKQIFVADNIFLTTMVEQGFLGLLTLFGIYGIAIWQLLRMIHLLRFKGDELNAGRIGILLQVLIIYILAGFFADVQLFAKVSKIFFLVIGMGMAIGRCALQELPVVYEQPAKFLIKDGDRLQVI